MNWSALFQTVQKASALLPAAIQVATTLEAVLPAGTPGLVKLEAVKTTMQNALAVEGMVEAEVTAIWAHLGPMVSTLITLVKRPPTVVNPVPPAPPVPQTTAAKSPTGNSGATKPAGSVASALHLKPH